MTKFQEKVYKVVSKIPKGETMTYKEVAVAIGNPKAYRAVGNALNMNPKPYYELNYHMQDKFAEGKSSKFEKVPCHRVIRSDGKAGGYVLGEEKKIKLLKKENAI